jgi:hypothetical protein
MAEKPSAGLAGAFMDVGFSPGPWEARKGGSITLLSGKQEYPATVVRVFRDEQNRRVTQFIAECKGAALPNYENARLIAQAPALFEERDALTFALGLSEQRIMRMRERNDELQADNNVLVGKIRASLVYLALALILVLVSILVGIVGSARKQAVGPVGAITCPPSNGTFTVGAAYGGTGVIAGDGGIFDTVDPLSDQERAELQRLRKQRAILDPYFKSGRLVIIEGKR